MNTTNETRKSPRNTQRGWLPIAEIASALEIQPGTIYGVVARAHALNQDWVKRDAYPFPGGPRKWLIDTKSPFFQYHCRRWRQRIAKRREHSRNYSPDEQFAGHGSSREEFPPSVSEGRATGWWFPFTNTRPRLAASSLGLGGFLVVIFLAMYQRWQGRQKRGTR